jgi:YHS domain-containing protein
MDVETASAPKSQNNGKTYYFCLVEHKKLFDKGPDQFLVQSPSK